MSPVLSYSIFRRFYLCVLLPMILAVSCQKDEMIDTYPVRVSFDVTGRLLEGVHITCIDIDTKGNIYVASDKELFYFNNSNNKSYSMEFPVLDLAIAPDETVWIGTNGGGLGHLTDKGFAWYTGANAGLPRDYVSNVETDSDGKVWFSSCAYNMGGLGIFNNNRFEFLTPENSPLNQNIIEDIEVDRDDRVYIATSGKVGRTNIYRIDGKTWDCLGDEDGMFYCVFSFTVGASGNIYLIENFSLSPSLYNTNSLFEFKDNKWQTVETGDMPLTGFFNPIKIDRRDYCWLAGYGNYTASLHVFDGKSWSHSSENLFPDDFITTIEVDNDNNIWVGTYYNGIFIFNQ